VNKRLRWKIKNGFEFMLEPEAENKMDWIERLKVVARDPYRAIPSIVESEVMYYGGRNLPTANPPASLEEILDFESKANVTLPVDLRRVYLEVGNGRFGPGNGLFPLVCTEEELQKVRKSLTPDRSPYLADLMKGHQMHIEAGLVSEAEVVRLLTWSGEAQKAEIEKEILDYRRYNEVLTRYLLSKDFPGSGPHQEHWGGYFLTLFDYDHGQHAKVDLRNGRVGYADYTYFDGSDSEESVFDKIEWHEFVEWRAPSIKVWFESWLDGKNLMRYSPEFREQLSKLADERNAGNP
jgi:cell wall assembly regulator SMI1